MVEASRLDRLVTAAGTRAHFVGIGGAGMAPLAAMLADRDWHVDGCDVGEGPITRELAARGIPVALGHAEEHVAGHDLFVASSAVPADAPELTAAAAAGIPVAKRAQLVGALTRHLEAVCVAGTHGKTTTTAMIAVGLRAAGADPSVLVGASVPGIGVGGCSGSGGLLVVEADEYDGSFLNFRPTVAVVTNVEADHLDYYQTRAAIDDAFRRFVALVPPQGHAVVCFDDPGARQIAPAGAIAYGRGDGCLWRAIEERPNDLGGYDFVALGPGGEHVPLRLAVPGQHNVLNALACAVVWHLTGVDPAKAAEGLAGFRGAARRFELKGEVDGVAIYDDYAHHPTEVRVVLAAARTRTRGRVWCVFQPHTYHRTAALWDEFAQAFGDADFVLMLDVYSPAGRESPIAGASSDRLIAAMAHPAARYVPSGEEAADVVAHEARPGDLVLTMGAGDVTRLGPLVLERLQAH